MELVVERENNFSIIGQLTDFRFGANSKDTFLL